MLEKFTSLPQAFHYHFEHTKSMLGKLMTLTIPSVLHYAWSEREKWHASTWDDAYHRRAGIAKQSLQHYNVLSQFTIVSQARDSCAEFYNWAQQSKGRRTWLRYALPRPTFAIDKTDTANGLHEQSHDNHRAGVRATRLGRWDPITSRWYALCLLWLKGGAMSLEYDFVVLVSPSRVSPRVTESGYSHHSSKMA